MAYMMRGGSLMDEALAKQYDKNRQDDMDAVQKFLPPDARIIGATQGSVIFSVQIDGNTWTGQMQRVDEGWTYRR